MSDRDWRAARRAEAPLALSRARGQARRAAALPRKDSAPDAERDPSVQPIRELPALSPTAPPLRLRALPTQPRRSPPPASAEKARNAGRPSRIRASAEGAA